MKPLLEVLKETRYAGAIFTSDSCQIAFDILEKARVAVTPGIDFGQNTEGYLRLSYANSIEKIEEGMNRLQIYFRNNTGRR